MRPTVQHVGRFRGMLDVFPAVQHVGRFRGMLDVFPGCWTFNCPTIPGGNDQSGICHHREGLQFPCQ